MSDAPRIDLISPEAREALAAAYEIDGKPWFAADIRAGRSRQFNVPLLLITGMIEGALKHRCEYLEDEPREDDRNG